MKIVAVDSRVVRWPIASTGAARGWSEREALIIAVTDELGNTGLGEAAPLPGMSIDALADAERAAGDLAARLPIAIDSPRHATTIADRVTHAPAARFAIETALLSCFAQRARRSLASLLSRVPQGELRHTVVVEDEVSARRAIEAGARCLKIKVGHAPTRVAADVNDEHQWVKDLARVVRIAAAANGASLRLDANRSWPRARVLPRLEQLANTPALIEYVEEPCVDAHELLYDADADADARAPREVDAPTGGAGGGSRLPIKLALDESLIDLAPTDLARVLESPDLAALVLKPTLLGGFARCLELAARAHGHGVMPIVTHALEGQVGFAACIELARAIGADVPVGLAPHAALACSPQEGPRQRSAHDVSAALPDRRQRSAGDVSAALPDRLSIRAAAREAGERPAIVTATRTLTFADCARMLDGDPISAEFKLPAVHVATPTIDTVLAVYRALEQRRPIALLHARASNAGIARQRAAIEGAELDDAAVVLFTSGSTAEPRGVVLSRDALLAAAAASAERLGWLDGGADDRWLCCLPLAHTGGLSILVRCLAYRQTVVLHEGDFDARAVAELARREHATLASLVPTQLDALLAEPSTLPREHTTVASLTPTHNDALLAEPKPGEHTMLGSLVPQNALLAEPSPLPRELATVASLTPTHNDALLAEPSTLPREHTVLGSREPNSAPLADSSPLPYARAILLGGAAAAPSLVERAVARGLPVLPTYGLTETFGQVATARVAGGPLVPLVGVSIDAGPAITIRGPMLATRYLDGAPIAPVFATADLGVIDDGVLRVLGRADDVIITGGENVHPAQVEAVLAETPGVRAACAFGVPDATWGELVGAALATDAGFDARAAMAHWQSSLPPHARPRRIACVVELPLLPNGKLDRRRVRDVPTVPVRYE